MCWATDSVSQSIGSPAVTHVRSTTTKQEWCCAELAETCRAAGTILKAKNQRVTPINIATEPGKTHGTSPSSTLRRQWWLSSQSSTQSTLHISIYTIAHIAGTTYTVQSTLQSTQSTLHDSIYFTRFNPLYTVQSTLHGSIHFTRFNPHYTVQSTYSSRNRLDWDRRLPPNKIQSHLFNGFNLVFDLFDTRHRAVLL
jgi:hypothetical protein